MRPTVFFGMMGYRGGPDVARALLGRCNVDFITNEPSTTLLREIGIPARPATEFLPDGVKEPLIAEAPETLHRMMQSFDSDVVREAYPEFQDDEWRRVRQRVHDLFGREMLPLLLNIECVRHCAATCDLRLQVYSEDVLPSTRVMIEAGERLGVPTLHVMHGVPYGPSAWQEYSPDTYVAAYSEHTKRLMVEMGANPEKVLVTGSPGWEKLAGPVSESHRRRCFARHGLDPNKPLIAYALTQAGTWTKRSARNPLHHVQHFEAVLLAFVVLAKRHPDWQFAIRPRPGGDKTCPVDEYLARARSRGLTRIVVDTGQPYNIEAMSDVFLATGSNMGVEAILLGKPVINVNLDGCGRDIYDTGCGQLYDSHDAALEVRDPEKIADAIERALLDDATRMRLEQARQYSIEKFNYRHDGKASDRVAGVIEQLIAPGRRYHPVIARFPELEHGLAAAVPDAADRVLIVGRAARWVAECIEARYPGAVLSTTMDPAAVDATYPAIVFSDPLPATPRVYELLDAAYRRLTDAGCVVAAAHNHAMTPVGRFPGFMGAPLVPGAQDPEWPGPMTYDGLALLLSRCDFDLLEVRDAMDVARPAQQGKGDVRGAENWVVTGRKRSEAQRGQRWMTTAPERDAAEAANAQGEALLGKGNVNEAIDCFSRAVGHAPDEALYHNNLGTALFESGRPDDAWQRFMDALSIDPDSPVVRDNLRALSAVLARTDEAERILRMFGVDTPSPREEEKAP